KVRTHVVMATHSTCASRARRSGPSDASQKAPGLSHNWHTACHMTEPAPPPKPKKPVPGPRPGQLACKPPGYYAAIDAPPASSEWQRIVVAMEDCMRAEPQTQRIDPDLTGRYADAFETRKNLSRRDFPLVAGINHLEAHIE